MLKSTIWRIGVLTCIALISNALIAGNGLNNMNNGATEKKEVPKDKIVGEWIIDNNKSIGIDGERIKEKNVYVFCDDNTYIFSSDGSILAGEYSIRNNTIEMTLPTKGDKGQVNKFIKVCSNVSEDKIEWHYYTFGKKVMETYLKSSGKVIPTISKK